MRKGTLITTAIIGGVVITALIATPTIAAMNWGGDEAGNGESVQNSQQHGRFGENSGGMHDGMHDDQVGGGDMGAGLADTASGILTDEQRAILTEMAAEETLAHDLYVAFAEEYEDATVFSRIARSETQHLEAVRTLLERYDIADPTVGLEAGTFENAETQELYDSLLAEGMVSLDGAMEAARTVEKMDIADLTAAMDGVTAPDLLKVYGNLLNASQHHLTAFGG